MSTNEPGEIARLAALAATRGIATLEAPVTGGVHRAAAGEITILVGGERVFERPPARLRGDGRPRSYMGPLGQRR